MSDPTLGPKDVNDDDVEVQPDQPAGDEQPAGEQPDETEPS